MGPWYKKLNTVIPRQLTTTVNIKTLIFAKSPAPTKQTNKFNVFIMEQYKNCHQRPSAIKPLAK